MPAAELRFRVMGGGAHVLVLGGAHGLATHARARLAALEGCWSRFLPTSDVARLNAAAGTAIQVAPETLALVRLAILAWRGTAGRFDPTVQQALVAAGYDRSFELLPRATAAARPPLAEPGPAPGPDPVSVPSPPASGPAGIVIDAAASTITLPHGSGIDLGGIGKGYAADLVVTELLGLGAQGACVNLGGDLRVAGQAPGGGGWVVAIERPDRPQQELARVSLSEGAVATSSPTARTWLRGGVRQHHLIDPTTGAPARSDLSQVTVLAGQAWEAEVLAKAALLAGRRTGRRLLIDAGVAGLLVDGAGNQTTTPTLKELLV